MSTYRRPKGVMGGSCLNCGLPQPAHANHTCEEAMEISKERMRHLSEEAVLRGTLNTAARAGRRGMAAALHFAGR